MRRAPAVRAAALLVCGLALLVVAGCVGAAPAAAPAGPFPPRPVPLAVERVDPCAALTSAQLARYPVRAGKPGSDRVEDVTSVGCTWGNLFGIGYNLQTIPLSAERAAGQTPKIVQVNGFGAVQTVVQEPGVYPVCMLTIDAADGQSIRVQALPPTAKNPPTQEVLCAQALEFSRDAMTTVVNTYRR